MENEQITGAHHVCSLLCVPDHQCDVRGQDNILPSVCMTCGHFKMSVRIQQHQKGVEVAVVLQKKSNQNCNKLTESKIPLTC